MNWARLKQEIAGIINFFLNILGLIVHLVINLIPAFFVVAAFTNPAFFKATGVVQPSEPDAANHFGESFFGLGLTVSIASCFVYGARHGSNAAIPYMELASASASRRRHFFLYNVRVFLLQVAIILTGLVARYLAKLLFPSFILPITLVAGTFPIIAFWAWRLLRMPQEATDSSPVIRGTSVNTYDTAKKRSRTLRERPRRQDD